jgi:hypothetical protein
MAEDETKPERNGDVDEAEAMARLQEEIQNLPVSEHVAYMLHSLSSLAVDRLGLAPDAAVRRDPAQARLAIDAFKALLGVLEPGLPSAEVLSYKGMLSQLQMAYVAALNAPTAPQDEPRAEERAEPAAPAEAPASAPAAEDAPKKPAKVRATTKGAATVKAATAPKNDAKPKSGQAAKGGAAKGEK